MLGCFLLSLLLLVATTASSGAAAAFGGYSSRPRNHHQQLQHQHWGILTTSGSQHQHNHHVLAPTRNPTVTVLSASFLLPTTEIASSILTNLAAVPDALPSSPVTFLFLWMNQQEHSNLVTLPDLHTTMIISSSSTSTSNNIAADTDLTWRQIVSLTICGLVLLDIVAGSPVAKGILNAGRPPSSDENEAEWNAVDGGGTENNNQQNWVERLVATSSQRDAATTTIMTTPSTTATTTTTKRAGAASPKNPKERVDIDAIAQAALDRAASIQQMKAYRDANKSDWQKIQELQRAVDRQLEEQQEQ